MPPELDYDGSSSGWAVHNFGYRLRIYQPAPGDRSIMWDLVSADRRKRSGTSVPLDDIPDMFRAHLQDWIAVAQSQPPKDTNAPK